MRRWRVHTQKERGYKPVADNTPEDTSTRMESFSNCLDRLSESLERTTKEQSVGFRAVKAIRDGEHVQLREMLHWECGGVKYRIRLKEPVDSSLITELGIPEHIYKAPEDSNKKGATLLELAAALGQTKCVEVLLDLGFQMSYSPIVKN